MEVKLVSMKVVLDLYVGGAGFPEAHSGFCVGDDVFLQADAGFRYS
jgi:hypothetical protein